MMRAPENSTRESSTSCCTPIGKSPRRARGSMSRPRFFSCAAAPRPSAATRRPEAVDRLVAEEDVLGDAEFRRDAELLMDHADPGRQRVARRAEMHVLSVDAHAPCVGAVDAGDDLHHRALARAVLAGQTMDLTGEQREVDLAKRLDAAKRLRDALEFEQRHGETSAAVQIRNCSCIQSIRRRWPW